MELEFKAFIVILHLIALFAIWRFGFRQLILDSYRQKLFTLRDKIFDDAIEGTVIKTTDPEYQALRTAINVSIRYAHRFSLFDILTAYLYTKDLPDRGKSFIPMRTNSKKLATYCEEIEEKFVSLSVGYYTLSSPFLLIGFLLGRIILKLLSSIFKLFKNPELASDIEYRLHIPERSAVRLMRFSEDKEAAMSDFFHHGKQCQVAS